MDLVNFTSSTVSNGIIVGIDSNRLNCSDYDRIFTMIEPERFDFLPMSINCSMYNSKVLSNMPIEQPTAMKMAENNTTIKIQSPQNSSSIPTTATINARVSNDNELGKLQSSRQNAAPNKNTRRKSNINYHEPESGMENHLILMTWFTGISLILIVLIAASTFWFGFRRKQKPIHVVYHQCSDNENLCETNSMANMVQEFHSRN